MRRRWDALCRWLVPAVLVLVAAGGAVRILASDQTAWKGATFGMFAQIDASSSRALRATALVDGQPTIVVPPPGAQGEVRVALENPSDTNLTAVGEALLGDHPDADEVTVAVLRSDFDPDGPTLRLVPVNDVTVSPDPGR